jgi:hypothetical protein
MQKCYFQLQDLISIDPRRGWDGGTAVLFFVVVVLLALQRRRMEHIPVQGSSGQEEVPPEHPCYHKACAQASKFHKVRVSPLVAPAAVLLWSSSR